MKKGLGKGLGALLMDSDLQSSETGQIDISINKIEPRKDQPRRVFDDTKLEDLAESIKAHGVVQPIIVNKEGDFYRIVAGERRWRASRLAGLTEVPVLVRDYTSKEIMEIALIENLQREDLNPLEEAEAYEKLLKEYNMTQEDISVSIGKSRSAIANTIRLLNLCDELKRYLEEGQITSGHARALMSIDDETAQIDFAKMIIKKDLSVRETEKGIKSFIKVKTERKSTVKPPEIRALEDRISEALGTKVAVYHKINSGRIQIDYYSNEELERLIEMFTK